jgi:predicted HTH domain antitoxin
MRNINVEIPQDILYHAKIKGDIRDEIKKELAIHLYKEKILSLGNAIKLSGLSFMDFYNLLGKRKIPRHYDISDLKKDLENIDKLL